MTTSTSMFKDHGHVIKPDHLSVVALPQDVTTKHILQSVSLRLARAGAQKNVGHER